LEDVKRSFLRAVVLLLLGVFLAMAVALAIAPDPTYRLRGWLARGRYTRHDPVIAGAAAEAKVDPLLLKAIAWRESEFNAGKIEGDRRGLLQISEPAALAWAAAGRVESFMFTDLFDPQTNLRAGAWLLSRAREHWKSSDAPDPFALVEFKAGRAQTEHWAGPRPTAASLLAAADAPTRDFVQAVLQRRDFYAAHGW
jgi:soluble lytic murein transglycosylase